MAQSIVLRWFLTAFFVCAALLIAGTWWQKSRACSVTCAAQGKADASLAFKGGGRFDLGTACVCGDTGGGK